MTEELKLSTIVALIERIRLTTGQWDRSKTETEVRKLFRVDHITDDLSETMVKVVLEELESKTEDWVLAVSPLGDRVGWRASVLVGDVQAQLGGASDPSWSKAVSLAVARARVKLEELKEEGVDMGRDQ